MELVRSLSDAGPSADREVQGPQQPLIGSRRAATGNVMSPRKRT
jgi:hypothetical protein